MDTKPDEHGRPPQCAPAIRTEPSPSRNQLDQFYVRALADVSLQEQLRAPDDTDRFIALVVDIARDCGFDLDAKSVRVAMRGGLPGMEGLIESHVSETPLPPKGWLPIRAVWQRDQLYVHWSHFGEQRLREPFFEGSVQRCLFKPFNRLFRYSTPITRLVDWLQAHPGLRPSGFIFHMSRCGSTLVSQMLAALPHNIVISEASPIDAVVRARHARRI